MIGGGKPPGGGMLVRGYGRTRRLAHRGDWRHNAENTLPALMAAFDQPGCDGVEFDVRAARDGTPVLLHDRTLSRVQGHAAPVASVSTRDLASVGVPALEDVLPAIPPGAFVNIELKDDPGDGVIDVLNTAANVPGPDRVVSSFKPATLGRIRRARPDWPCWLNSDHVCDEVVRQAVKAGCTGLSVRWQALSRTAAARAHDAGLALAAWTAREASTEPALAGFGLAAVCVEGAAFGAPGAGQPGRHSRRAGRDSNPRPED
jgi:glycerophosphoryl diester phosphodiesterase